jgi:hypothetical protein
VAEKPLAKPPVNMGEIECYPDFPGITGYEARRAKRRVLYFWPSDSPGSARVPQRLWLGNAASLP